jgi:hypothetical protein
VTRVSTETLEVKEELEWRGICQECMAFQPVGERERVLGDRGLVRARRGEAGGAEENENSLTWELWKVGDR